MHRRAVIASAAVLAVGACVGAWAVLRWRRAHAPLEWSGTVEAYTIDVGSRVGGRVSEVRVREGATVDAGQVLLVFEPGDLEGQKLQAQGALEQAQAALDRLVSHGASTVRQQQVAAAKAQLQAQEASLAKATVDLKRARTLFEAHASPQLELDTARAAFDSAKAQRAAAQAGLDQVLSAIDPDVKAANGQVMAARGRLDQLETALAELDVISPRLARVEALDLRPGDLVSPGATVARLLEPDELFVRIYVPETELGWVGPGLPVPLYVDTFPDRAFDAIVQSVRDEGEFSPRNLQTADERANQVFAVRVGVANDAGVLKPGMAATVRVKR